MTIECRLTKRQNFEASGVLLFEEDAKSAEKHSVRPLLPALRTQLYVNNEIIYDRYTMIVINRISAGRQNVPLCEELRFRCQPQPLPAPPSRCRYFTAGTQYTAGIIYLFSNMPAPIDLHILI